jgi:hypothetical protein
MSLVKFGFLALTGHPYHEVVFLPFRPDRSYWCLNQMTYCTRPITELYLGSQLNVSGRYMDAHLSGTFTGVSTLTSNIPGVYWHIANE